MACEQPTHTPAANSSHMSLRTAAPFGPELALAPLRAWTLDGFLDGPIRSAYERALATTEHHTIITVLHAGRIKETALGLEIRNPAPFEPVPDDRLTESDRLRAAVERARWEATDSAQHERSEDSP